MGYEDYEKIIKKIKLREKRQFGFESTELLIQKLFTIAIVLISFYMIFDIISSKATFESLALKVSVIAFIYSLVNVFISIMNSKADNSRGVVLNRILYYLYLIFSLENNNILSVEEKKKLQELLNKSIEDIYK